MRQFGNDIAGRGSLALLALLVCVAARPLRATSILFVQPFDVCDSSSGACGDPDEQLFSSATEAIWNQAGIAIDFLSWGEFSAPAADYADMNTIGNFATLAGLVPAPYSSESAQVVWMFFVPQIDSCGGAGGTVYGCSLTPGNEDVISNAVFSSSDGGYSGSDRIDTIAHELGHSLGLPDCSTCGANNLEAIGNIRNVPRSLSDIYPNGSYDQLTSAQIAVADSSRFLFPEEGSTTSEPGTTFLTAAGLLGLGLRIRRTRARA